MTWLRAAILAAIVLSSTACSRDASERPRPNVVLVILDTTRADAVSTYGAPPDTSPASSALARSGLQYDHAYSNSNWTLPSHATLFTGLLPTSHGLGEGAQVLPKVPTLAGQLAAAGYETAGFVENLWLKGSGLERDFADYRLAPRGAILKAIERWYEERRKDRPFFLFVNLMEAHSPYLVRPVNPFLPAGVDAAGARSVDQHLENYLCRCSRDDPEVGIMHGLYLGNVRAADDKLASILRIVEPARAAAPLIVVVSSDHGEHFGENGLMAHHIGVGNALLHVPLIVNGLPGVEPARIRAPVQLADVMPSILAWTGTPIPPDLAGDPLPLREPGQTRQRPLIAASTDPLESWKDLPKAFAEAADAHLNHCNDADRVKGKMRSITRFPFKLRWYEAYPSQLFNLESDPNEERDLAAEMPEVVAKLAGELDTEISIATRHRSGETRKLTAAEVERLRALGYLGGNAAAGPTESRGQE